MGMSVMSDVTLVPQKSDIWWVFLLQGFAGIIIGLMLITEPGATLVALMTVLGFYWLITGVLALVQVFVDRATPWIWSLLAGLVGILAGLFVLRHPLVAALTVPTVLEPISKSSEEDNEAGELDEAEEVLGVILPADENAALPLDPSEEALDEPASHVAA